ncbi:MAG TPA: citryl-CoA lyase [Polyangiaceae bacterium]
MKSLPAEQSTSIATSTKDDVFIRDKSLCKELLGSFTFTEMIYFQVLGVRPAPAQTKLLDACLVTLMEHGLTPSALAARLVYSSAEEAMQGAVAAGLLAVGSRFVGTSEGCGVLIERVIAAGADGPAEARRIASEARAAREPIPGFGHPFHKPDDPRSIRLLELAREEGLSGAHVAAVNELSRAIDEVYGKHITLNATGAVAAVLGDAGVPREILRGFALIARCAGLVGHVHEEQQKPAMRAIWEAGERAVPYDGRSGRE